LLWRNGLDSDEYHVLMDLIMYFFLGLLSPIFYRLDR